VQTSGHTWDAGKRVSAFFAEDTPKDGALKQTFSRHAVRLQESFSGRRWGHGMSVPSGEQKKRLRLQVMLRGQPAQALRWRTFTHYDERGTIVFGLKSSTHI
jgi:hypothetical protein